MTDTQEPSIEWTISWSRCLWCGRKTPHEVCHEHSHNFTPDEREIERLDHWPNYYLPAETCDLPDGHL